MVLQQQLSWQMKKDYIDQKLSIFTLAHELANVFKMTSGFFSTTLDVRPHGEESGHIKKNERI